MNDGAHTKPADLGRFFRHLVNRLAATAPDRLHVPLPLAEIRQTILPYRANRRALKLESSEDYELMLLRLCAGEGGFARIEPEEAQAEFVAEARSSNPDLAMAERHQEAVVILNENQVAQALNPVSDIAFAPPEQRYAPKTQPVSPAKRGTPDTRRDSNGAKAGPSAAAICRSCGGKLPAGRAAKFCPQCGESQAPPRCPKCHADLESGWRHCVNCGTALRPKFA